MKMFEKTIFRLFIVCFFLMCHGCTYQGWYEGLNEQQRQMCYQQNPSQSEIRNCLDKANGKSYDEYKKERDEIVKKAE